MKPTKRDIHQQKWKLSGPAVITWLLLLAAMGSVAWWSIGHAPHPFPNTLVPEATGDGASPGPELAALVAPKTQSLAPKTNPSVVLANGRSSGLEVTGVPARPSRIRSALENSPGYYPPADPESLSQVTGRREAVVVNAELSGGMGSLDDLAKALLAGIESRDERALHSLRVSRREFEEILWPEFPQSRPITHIPVEEVWGFQTAKSLAGATRTVGFYGGRHLGFVRADYSRVESYRNFNLYRGVLILVRDPKYGRQMSLAFVPSVVERHGRFKALIFKD